MSALPGDNYLWLDTAGLTKPQEAVDRDQELLQALAEGRCPQAYRIWTNRPCIVVSRKDSRMPTFQKACDTLGKTGFPVIVRTTGGTAVVHGSGVLNLSIFSHVPGSETFSIKCSYVSLCDPVIKCLATLGMNAYTASVENTFCDGRYNVVVDGRKIAGTAQRVMTSRKDAGRVVLSHISLLVDVAPETVCRLLGSFYSEAGDARVFDPDSVTSVVLENPDLNMDAVIRALAGVIQAQLKEVSGQQLEWHSALPL